jgi:hypothetical protein
MFPSRIVLEVLELVITQNTFQFGDTFWQQFVGTAMGTLCACVYATVVYSYHERRHDTSQLTKQVLPYLKRVIDDMLGIWCGADDKWELFKASLDGFGKPKWITSERASQVMFLDLKITIDPSSRHITTKTYQKPQNLHLYIPSTSAHPEACFQGTMIRNIIRYWNQNSSRTDFGTLLKQFADRLSLRGHAMRAVMHLIEKATTYVDENLTCKPTKMVAKKKNAPCFCTDSIIQNT